MTKPQASQLLLIVLSQGVNMALNVNCFLCNQRTIFRWWYFRGRQNGFEIERKKLFVIGKSKKTGYFNNMENLDIKYHKKLNDLITEEGANGSRNTICHTQTWQEGVERGNLHRTRSFLEGFCIIFTSYLYTFHHGSGFSFYSPDHRYSQ